MTYYFTKDELDMALDQIKRIESGLLTPAWTAQEIRMVEKAEKLRDAGKLKVY